MKRKDPQLSLLEKKPLAYGGDLLKTRKGRRGGRPLETKSTIHLVLRSTKAKGDWSFKKPKNERAIQNIVKKFAHKYQIKVISLANVGNHLHFHIKLNKLWTYKPFIRAITSAIAMAVTGTNRWTKSEASSSISTASKAMNLSLQRVISRGGISGNGKFAIDARTTKKAPEVKLSTKASFTKQKFWDNRPFTRVVRSLKALLTLRDYIHINELEGFGYRREEARFLVQYVGAQNQGLRSTA